MIVALPDAVKVTPRPELAVALTVVANADTLKIAKGLWTEPGVRAALVAQAQQYAAQQAPKPAASAAPQAQAPGAAAGAKSGPPLPPPESPAEAEDLVTAEENLQTSLKQLRSMAVPFGWRDAMDPEDQREKFPPTDQLGTLVWSHALGWALTAVAVSLGSPFWFDLLNKLISIRASGKAPEKKTAGA